MKKTYLFLIGLVLISSVFFMACSEGAAPPMPEPEPEVPPTFEEVIGGKFWTLDRVERYQDTGARMATADPYALDICAYWTEEGEIFFYVDKNEDGVISPSEPVSGPLTWSIVDDTLYIDGLDWEISYFNGSGWAIERFISGEELETMFDDYGDYEGWIKLHYVPCLKVFDDGIKKLGFAFAFDDKFDCDAEWVYRYCHWWGYKCTLDYADGFYFTTGTPADSYADDDPVLGNHVIIAGIVDSGYDTDALIIVYNEERGYKEKFTVKGFNPDHVYDMELTVDSADVAIFVFTSRVDGTSFRIRTKMDNTAMGDVQIRAINDVDVPVVNP